MDIGPNQEPNYDLNRTFSFTADQSRYRVIAPPNADQQPWWKGMLQKAASLFEKLKLGEGDVLEKSGRSFFVKRPSQSQQSRSINVSFSVPDGIPNFEMTIEVPQIPQAPELEPDLPEIDYRLPLQELRDEIEASGIREGDPLREKINQVLNTLDFESSDEEIEEAETKIKDLIDNTLFENLYGLSGEKMKNFSESVFRSGYEFLKEPGTHLREKLLLVKSDGLSNSDFRELSRVSKPPRKERGLSRAELMANSLQFFSIERLQSLQEHFDNKKPSLENVHGDEEELAALDNMLNLIGDELVNKIQDQDGRR